MNQMKLWVSVSRIVCIQSTVIITHFKMKYLSIILIIAHNFDFNRLKLGRRIGWYVKLHIFILIITHFETQQADM